MKSGRPKIEVKRTFIDWIVDGFIILALVYLWIFVSARYNSLPEVIPSHFDLRGRVDGIGPRYVIWVLPVLATIIAIAIYWLNQYPHIFNYPVKITEENAGRQYRMATRLMRYLSLVTVIVFGYLTILVFAPSMTDAAPWILGLIVLPLVPVMAYMVLTIRKKEGRPA